MLFPKRGAELEKEARPPILIVFARSASRTAQSRVRTSLPSALKFSTASMFTPWPDGQSAARHSGKCWPNNEYLSVRYRSVVKNKACNLARFVISDEFRTSSSWSKTGPPGVNPDLAIVDPSWR